MRSKIAGECGLDLRLLGRNIDIRGSNPAALESLDNAGH